MWKQANNSIPNNLKPVKGRGIPKSGKGRRRTTAERKAARERHHQRDPKMREMFDRLRVNAGDLGALEYIQPVLNRHRTDNPRVYTSIVGVGSVPLKDHDELRLHSLTASSIPPRGVFTLQEPVQPLPCTTHMDSVKPKVT
jgi:hypothetical protein